MAMLVTYQLANTLNGPARFVPYILFRFFAMRTKTDFERAELLEPQPFEMAPLMCGWETFGFLVAAVYVPIAPFATAVSCIYLATALFYAKYESALCSETTFQSCAAWALGVQQTHTCLYIAYFTSLLVLVLMGQFWKGCALVPLFFVLKHYTSAAHTRYLTRNPHGVARGLLPLSEAGTIDSARGEHYQVVQDEALTASRFWAQREALPLDGDVLPGKPLADDEEITDRLIAIKGWTSRYLKFV